MTIDFTDEQLQSLSRLVETRARQLTAQMADPETRRPELARELEAVMSLARQVERARFANAVEIAAEFS